MTTVPVSEEAEIVDKTPTEIIDERDNILSKAKAKRDGKISKSENGMKGLLQKAEEQKNTILQTANNMYHEFEQKCNTEANGNDDDSKNETVAILIAKAVTMRDSKISHAELTYENISKKTQLKHKNITEKENQKYDVFEEQLLLDYERKLAIAERIERKKNKQRREDAKQQRTQQRIEKARVARENEQKEAQENIERIKNLKPGKKKRKSGQQEAVVVKYKLPGKLLKMKDSKAVSKSLKKYTGRYCFLCFWKADEKSFAKFFDKLSSKYQKNIAWLNCGPLGPVFHPSMLLYEFNATPAVVICYNGKTSNKYRYVLGDNEESRALLKQFAEECDNEE